MSLNGTKTVVTPEQVVLTYVLAGVGTRFAAMLVDTLIQGLVALAVIVTVSALFPGVSLLLDRASSWLLAVLIIILFGIIWGYFIFWEMVWNGQSPGKRATGIRVVRDGGYPIDFRASFLRNITRYVDFLPVSYGVGALVMFASRDSKRLGDYIAGTLVIVDSQRSGKGRPTTAVAGPGYGLLVSQDRLNLRALSREQFAVVDRFLSRREELPNDVRADLARRIAAPIMPIIGMEVPTDARFPYESFLLELASAYRAWSQGAGVGD